MVTERVSPTDQGILTPRPEANVAEPPSLKHTMLLWQFFVRDIFSQQSKHDDERKP
jgi:hypothetical protein